MAEPAPAPTHPSTRPSRRGGVVGLLVCLLAVLGLVWSTPAPSSERELVVTAEPVGSNGATDWLELERIGIRLVDLQLADAVVPGAAEPVSARPDTVLVVATWQVRVTGEPLDAVTELRVDGLTYAERPEFSGQSLTTTQPGFSLTCSAVYEIPRDRVGDAVMVVVPRGGVLQTYRRLGGFALPLDELAMRGTVPIGDPVIEVTP